MAYVVDSHIQRIGCQPEKLLVLYTMANPARGLLHRETRTKEKIWQRIPPPPPPLLAPVQDSFDSSIRPRGVASQKKYVSVCDNNFHGLVVSFFSWRCLATSTSYVPHAATNILLPSVTVSTHTSSSDAVVFQSPAMPNARMSLCTQSVNSFSFPPCPLRTAP